MDDPRGNRIPAAVSHYIIESLLGTGGMGSVYSAVDQRDGTLVAIKLLHPHLAQDPSFKERFEREAHVAALLRSPYTVHILDYGVVEGRYFIAMQYVDGQTLGQALHEGPLPVDRALRVAGQVARALEEAQARGVVHRDIKPENVLLWGEDNVKVSDFGIARQSGAATLTVPGAFYGTLSYAAPEQFRGEADHRSDIYALGATLYHMLAGRPPFSGSFEEMQKEITEAPLPLEPLAALDAAVVQIVSRCLEKQPDQRYQSASELAAALERTARSTTAPTAEKTSRPGPSAPTEVVGATAGRDLLSMRLGAPRAGFPFTARLGTAKYEVTVQNHSDEEIEVWLRAEDRGRRCRFKLPGSITVAPRALRTALLSVRPVRRRWRGARETRVFTAYASAGGEGPPVSVSGRFDDLPHGWVPYGGVASVGAAAALLAGGAFAVGAIGPTPDPEPLRIGLLMPFSGLQPEGGGPWEEYGSAYLNAARIAVGEINADGGVLGQPMVLVQGDTAGDIEVGVQEARRLVDEEGVQAIIGDVYINSALDIADMVTNPGKVVQISPNSVEFSIQNDLPFLFKTEVKREAAEAVALAQLIAEGEYESVCSIYEGAFEGTRWNEALKRLSSGAQIVEVRHSPAEQGLTPEQIAAFYERTAASEIEQCAGTDAMVLSVFPDLLPPSEGAPPGQLVVTSYLLKQALDTGVAPILLASFVTSGFIGSPGDSANVFDSIGWERLAGVKGTRAGQAEERQGKNFDETYGNRFSEPPAGLQDPSLFPPDLRTIYDAVYLIALAAQKAGSTDPDAIRNALPEVANAPGTVIEPGPLGSPGGGFKTALELIAKGEDIDYEGAAGPIEFNADNDNVRGAVDVWRVDPQARALVTERILIVDLGTDDAAPPVLKEVTSSAFVTPVTVTLGPGFEVVEDQLPTDFALYREHRSQSGPDAYLRFLSPISLFKGDPLPGDLITWFETKEGVEVVEAKDVTIAGLPAKQIDVKGVAEVTGLFEMESGPFFLVSRELARFVILDVNGHLVVIAGGPDFTNYLPDGEVVPFETVFEEILPDIEAMLATVRFEP